MVRFPPPKSHDTFCPPPPLRIPKRLGSDFGRTDFSRIFIFGPPDFFADFLAGFFLLIFVGKVPRKILQENPRENPPKFIQQKSSDTLLQIGWGKKEGSRDCFGEGSKRGSWKLFCSGHFEGSGSA